MINYQDAMITLSQCGLGMIILSEDGRILEISEEGDRLLHGEGTLAGKLLAEVAPELLTESKHPLYTSPAFGEYLLRCPAPEVSGLPGGAKAIAFRPAAADAARDTLIQVLDRLNECVVIADAEGRMSFLNDAAVRLDSMVNSDVRGKHVTEVYTMNGGEDFQIPLVLKEKRSHLHMHQHYTTRYGKIVETTSNCHPIVQHGQVLGAVNILEDWSTIDRLNQQVVDLQEKLLAMEGERKVKKSALTATYRFSDIIRQSPVMQQVIEQCEQVASSDSSVMIYGETGTGKELLAQSIHNASKRAGGPFLAINCAALPETLLESMLFGTEKGAFTGAESHAGLLEQADQGTLLLDELNSMNITLQAKLLRFLQDGMIRRIGGMTEKRVNVRVLSNLNMPPYEAISRGLIRQDLFFRLGVVNINLPPLRERREDIPLLTKTFIMNCNEKLSRNVQNITPETLELFYRYSWPGNVRELQHAVEHAINVMPDSRVLITPDYIPTHIRGLTSPGSMYFGSVPASGADSSKAGPAPTAPVDPSATGVSFGGIISNGPTGPEARDTASPAGNLPGPYEARTERETLLALLVECRGNISAAARKLNISRQNLQYRLKKEHIDVKDIKGAVALSAAAFF